MERTEKELDDAIGRIGYSIELLTQAASWIAMHRRQHAGHQIPEWNAHIEAFLIHARKLSEFLDPQGNRHRNDVRPGDSFLPQSAIRSPSNRMCGTRSASKRVAHFSHAPVPDNMAVMKWPITAMTEAIRKATESFATDLEQNDRQRWLRIDRALRATEPHFRKAVQG